MADDAVAGLMAALKKNEIEYLRFEMADMAGVSRSKTVPVDKVESYARKGLNFYGGLQGLDTASNVVPGSGLHTQRNYADQALFPDPRFPSESVAARRLIVVAHEQPGFRRQRKQLPDRSIKLPGTAAGEVGAGGTIVGHEQCIADEDRIADLVADAGRRVARCMDDLDIQTADLDRLAILEKPVEIASTGFGFSPPASFMMEPLPKARSICASAASSAFCLSPEI